MAEQLLTNARAVVKLDPGTDPKTVAALTSMEITVVDQDETAPELAESIGADHTVLAGQSSEQDVVTKLVQNITGGGAHIVFDFVGEQGMEKLSPRLLRPRGSHYVIGYGGAVQLDTIDIISREITVIGNLVGTYNDLVELLGLSAAGKVELGTKQYSLDATIDAMHASIAANWPALAAFSCREL